MKVIFMPTLSNAIINFISLLNNDSAKFFERILQQMYFQSKVRLRKIFISLVNYKI